MNARNKDPSLQLFKNLKILPFRLQYITISPSIIRNHKIEIYMNRIQKFITLTPHLILVYISQIQN
jgi:hypothetical protein